MPELVLLTLARREFQETHRAAERGDEDALRAIEGIWGEYADRDLLCFLCDRFTEHPPFSFVIGELGVPSRVTVVPLCASCQTLPKTVRLHRCMRLLRKMYHAKTGRQAHFKLSPR